MGFGAITKHCTVCVMMIVPGVEFDYQFCQRELFGIRHCFVLINSLTENHQVIGKLDHLKETSSV